jgi:hypothetical protein
VVILHLVATLQVVPRINHLAMIITGVPPDLMMMEVEVETRHNPVQVVLVKVRNKAVRKKILH